MNITHQQILVKALSQVLYPSRQIKTAKNTTLQGGRLLSELTFQDFETLAAYARRSMNAGVHSATMLHV